MTRLLATACLLAYVPALYGQHVILDLDRGYPEDQFYFLTYNAESRIELRASTTGYRAKSARATWRIEAGDGRLGYVGFGYFHGIAAPPNPFPDLSAYTHLSLWYNHTTPASSSHPVTFRFELYEREAETDPQGRSGLQTWVYETPGVVGTPSGWTQLVMPLTAAQAVGEDGFATPTGGFAGDGVLDLDKIKHWGIVLVATDMPVGTAISGVTLFDYLTAERRASTPVGAPDAPLVTAFGAPYPNPFAADVVLPYSLEQAAEASVVVYDVMGRQVAVAVAPRPHTAGLHEARFDGASLAAGMYLCVLTADGVRHTRLVTRLP